MDHDRRHLKAAKALIIVMPMLGFGQILTLVVKPTIESLNIPLAILIFNNVEAVMTSTQGFIISLPYCFLNGEVQNVIRIKMRRWQMMRTVGRSGNLSARTSITASQTYFVSQRCTGQVIINKKLKQICKVHLV